MPSTATMFAATLLVAGLSTPAFAEDRAEDSPPTNFDEVKWQTATPDDLTLFEPYIGTFRSETYTSQTSGKAFFFTITYDWYNNAKTLIKWTIYTHIPEDGVERLNGEGFYGFDAFEERIFVSGYFPGRPAAGNGWMSDFDVETHERAIRVQTKSPDGSVTQVRDTFWVIDENSWKNVTFISVDGGEWQEVNSGTYTRVDS